MAPSPARTSSDCSVQCWRPGPGSAVSRRAALDWHGLRGFASRLIEVSRPTAVDQPLVGVRLHRSSDLGPDWISDVRRYARHDAGSNAGRPGCGGATWRGAMVHGGMAGRSGGAQWTALRDALDALSRKGRSGVGVLRRLLDERVLVDLIPDSRAEVLLVEILLAHGLPEPAFHHLVEVGGTSIAELDVAYPQQRVALEVDGYGVHLRSQEVFENERHRQNDLEILGWAVLRFTRRGLRDHPDRVADQVRRILRALERRNPGNSAAGSTSSVHAAAEKRGVWPTRELCCSMHILCACSSREC